MRFIFRLPLLILAILGVEKLLNWGMDSVEHFVVIVFIVAVAGAVYMFAEPNGN